LNWNVWCKELYLKPLLAFSFSDAKGDDDDDEDDDNDDTKYDVNNDNKSNKELHLLYSVTL
jgi:hypothetical protein